MTPTDNPKSNCGESTTINQTPSECKYYFVAAANDVTDHDSSNADASASITNPKRIKTMENDYCDYKLSLALKACGFDEPCIAQWAAEPDGLPILMGSTAFVFRNNDCQGRDVAAPFLWQAQKWLREKHHISIRVSYIAFHKVWFADWLNLDSGEFDDTDVTFDTYEEALADGICAAMELIKKGE